MRNGWEYKKLEEVCDFQGGSQPPKMEWSKEPQTGYVRMLQIRDFTQNATDYIEYVKESKSLKYCKEDDILIGRYGASVGKILTGLSGAYNVAIIKTIPIEIVNKNYIKYYFLSPQFQHNLLTVSQHRAAQAGFSKEDISDFIFPLPPLSEQERIVSELDLLTSIINKQKAQLKELDSLAQSIFYDMFGDPIENPKGWEMIPLNSVGQIARGVSKHRPRNAPELLGSFIPLIQTGDVANSGMYIMESQYGYSKLGMEQSKVWPSGTLCITIAANIGKCSIMTFDACFPDSVVGFTPNPDCILVVYVYFFFKSIQKALEDNAMGVAQKNINLKILNDMKIPLPPLSLQQTFASKVEAIEAQKALITKSMEETQRLFDSRMDYWFA